MSDAQEEDELFYYDLFLRLRDARFPLGIADYLEFLNAIQTQVYPLEREGMKRLCQVLWVKSVQQRQQFEAIFSELRVERTAPVATVVEQKIEQESEFEPKRELPDAPTPPPTPTPTPDSQPPEKYVYCPPATNPTENLVQDVEVGKAVRTTQPQEWMAFRSTGQKDEYFPVSAQQMRQGWYRLKRPIQQGVRQELDIAATIEEMKRRGKTVPPVLKPRRRKQSPLVLLIDYRGSMQPFHVLAHQLVMTAQQAGCLEPENCYYFDNYPQETLYGDADFDREVLLTDVFAQLNPEWTVVLIFSDAGATQGDLNRRRLRETTDFLEQLQRRVKAMVWLNPLPESRWEDWWDRTTTAGEIHRSKTIKMFAADYAGWLQAMQVLQ